MQGGCVLLSQALFDIIIDFTYEFYRPGSSGMIAFMTENGPIHITPNYTLVRNQFAWNGEADVFWVDQPVGMRLLLFLCLQLSSFIRFVFPVILE